VTPFASDQWIILGLMLLLGLLLGMMLAGGGKWKRRYREEAARRQELEAENARLLHDGRQGEMLRDAASRHPVDHGDHRPL